MSVLNQCGEEQVECPLCMEPLEVDDLTFFPCTCGYQICRFCWHRIRTDENGLCPACRKAYPEDPADFKPLSQEEVVKLKAEKRHKDQQRKQRITENRKHLANVRVVQKNLVFVVGLPLRLADSEMLKKHEYFGKFGKIHKVVINQSTSYAGSQGPSASAYVTYHRSDDALRAIQSVNNIAVDGRPVKTSLGTTKYCSHFMKNQPCPKQDCMYLHELGDPEASFTKEQMQQGKHQEYEKKLHEQLQASTLNRKPTPSPPTVPPSGQCGTNKEAWPSLNPNQLNSSVIVGVVPSTSPPEPTLMPVPPPSNKCDRKPQNSSKHKTRTTSDDNRKLKDSSGTLSGSPELSYKSSSDLSGCDESEISEGRKSHASLSEHNDVEELLVPSHTPPQNHLQQNSLPDHNHHQNHQTMHNGRDFGSARYNGSARHNSQQTDHIFGRHRGPSIYESDNNSLFSSNSYSKLKNYSSGTNGDWKMNGVNHHLPDVLPEVNSTEDWQAALGFPRQTHDHQEQQCLRDDDLGFDPFHETQKALAELIEKEEQHRYQPKLKHHNNRLNNCSKLIEGLRLGNGTRPPPPGFTTAPNHMNAFGLGIPRTGSKILPYIHPLTFQAHAQPPSGWDWPSLDPAIVTSAQHCDLYANPPPGFQLRQPLDNL